MSKKIENPKLINLTLLSHFKSKIDELLNNKVNKTDIASYENLGISKPDGNTILISEDGVLSSVATSNVQEKELLLSEYQALSKEEKNNDTNYYITDADNIDDVGSVGTAGSLKPWLYDSDEEVVIGVYNGKPLYRKYFTINVTGSNNAWSEYPIADYIDNVEYVRYWEVFNNSNNSLPQLIVELNATGKISNWSVSVNVLNSTGIIRFSFGNDNPYTDIPCTFMFEYTKTTDAENSGVNLMPYTYVQNASNIYSTEEQVIGKWIDGKPLYQRTINYGTLPNTQIQDKEHGIDNVKEIWIIGGWCKNANNGFVNQLNVPVPNGLENAFYFGVNTTIIRCETGIDRTNYSAYVTVQYTKTTD